MAFYDYKCEDCEYIEKDIQHNINIKIHIYCPRCNKVLIKALPTGTTFKGKGLVGKIRK